MASQTSTTKTRQPRTPKPVVDRTPVEVAPNHFVVAPSKPGGYEHHLLVQRDGKRVLCGSDCPAVVYSKTHRCPHEAAVEAVLAARHPARRQISDEDLANMVRDLVW